MIFCLNEEQKKKAEASRQALERSKAYAKPIVTEIALAPEFYPAEDYHRDYFNQHSDAPYCRFVIAPKLQKLKMKH